MSSHDARRAPSCRSTARRPGAWPKRRPPRWSCVPDGRDDEDGLASNATTRPDHQFAAPGGGGCPLGHTDRRASLSRLPRRHAQDVHLADRPRGGVVQSEGRVIGCGRGDRPLYVPRVRALVRSSDRERQPGRRTGHALDRRRALWLARRAREENTPATRGSKTGRDGRSRERRAAGADPGICPGCHHRNRRAAHREGIQQRGRTRVSMRGRRRHRTTVQPLRIEANADAAEGGITVAAARRGTTAIPMGAGRGHRLAQKR